MPARFQFIYCAIKRLFVETFIVILVCFNSFTVQLKVFGSCICYSQIMQFQFIYCAIKSKLTIFPDNIILCRFNSFTVQLKERGNNNIPILLHRFNSFTVQLKVICVSYGYCKGFIVSIHLLCN